MKKRELLRGLPKIDEVMKQESLVVMSKEKGDLTATNAVRSVISELRESVLGLDESEADGFDASLLTEESVAESAVKKMLKDEKLRLHPVVNATGTILHTNLGRAPLCDDALKNVMRVAAGYSNLEYSVEGGRRGSRHDIVSGLVSELAGAEDAIVVNNNASAIVLVLASICGGREVIVSRGELVEIGGSFRIPDIMRQSGAVLREVGTTNRTRASDYENAIIKGEQSGDIGRPETGALMKVHKSNYEIVGFTEETRIDELADLGVRYELPVIFDMGSGLILDMSEYGLKEPNVPASLAAGIDIVLFSGDKLLGGPQAGIIAGKRKYIEKMKNHPLMRAMRVDKLTLAALEATLVKYRDPETALRDIPVLHMISSSAEEMREKASRLSEAVKRANPEISAEIVPVYDQIGGGSAPLVRLPGWAVSVKEEGRSPDSMERSLREAEIPVIARISDDRLLLCVRTMFEADLEIAARTFE